MVGFNGVAACIQADNAATIMADACNVGAGAFCEGDFMYINWAVDRPGFIKTHINYKEVMAAALAVIRWAPWFTNRTVYIYTDNQCAKAVINKCSCRDDNVMLTLRDMFWASVKYNFHVKAIFMPGAKNTIADATSRLHEPGRLLQLEGIINSWNINHLGIYDAFLSVSLCNHMSMGALFSIFSQVEQWQHLRGRWMR